MAQSWLEHSQQLVQVRRVDQTQYTMIVVASLSAVPQSCRALLHCSFSKPKNCPNVPKGPRVTHTQLHCILFLVRVVTQRHELPELPRKHKSTKKSTEKN